MAWIDALRKKASPMTTLASTVKQQANLPELDPKKTPQAAPTGGWLSNLASGVKGAIQPGAESVMSALSSVGKSMTPVTTAQAVPTAQAPIPSYTEWLASNNLKPPGNTMDSLTSKEPIPQDLLPGGIVTRSNRTGIPTVGATPPPVPGSGTYSPTAGPVTAPPTSADLGQKVVQEWMDRLAGKTSGQMQGFNVQNARDVASQQTALADQYGSRVAPAALARMQQQAQMQGEGARTKFQSDLQQTAAKEAGAFVGQQQEAKLNLAKIQIQADEFNRELEDRAAERRNKYALLNDQYQLDVQRLGADVAFRNRQAALDELKRQDELDAQQSKAIQDYLWKAAALFTGGKIG